MHPVRRTLLQLARRSRTASQRGERRSAPICDHATNTARTPNRRASGSHVETDRGQILKISVSARKKQLTFIYTAGLSSRSVAQIFPGLGLLLVERPITTLSVYSADVRPLEQDDRKQFFTEKPTGTCNHGEASRACFDRSIARVRSKSKNVWQTQSKPSTLHLLSDRDSSALL